MKECLTWIDIRDHFFVLRPLIQSKKNKRLRVSHRDWCGSRTTQLDQALIGLPRTKKAEGVAYAVVLDSSAVCKECAAKVRRKTALVHYHRQSCIHRIQNLKCELVNVFIMQKAMKGSGTIADLQKGCAQRPQICPPKPR